MSDYKGKRLSVDVAPLYYSQEPIKFSVNYVDKNLNFDQRAELTVELRDEQNNTVTKHTQKHATPKFESRANV